MLVQSVDAVPKLRFLIVIPDCPTIDINIKTGGISIASGRDRRSRRIDFFQLMLFAANGKFSFKTLDGCFELLDSSSVSVLET
jgi:hypothetical protein